MATSYSFDKTKWRENLRDRKSWLKGYRKALRLRVIRFDHVCWNVGMKPMASFTRAISSIAVEAYTLRYTGLFNHVIKVDLKPADEAIGSGILSFKHQLAVAVAKDLGLLNQEYNRLKEKHQELRYYSYGSYCGGTSKVLGDHVQNHIVPEILKQLITEKYLLLVENLQWPIDRGSFTENVGLPPPAWRNSRWIISSTSHDAYNKSKLKEDIVISIQRDDEVLMLTLVSLHQAAEHIHKMIRQESKQYWHHIALGCFHYVMAIFTKHSQETVVTSDELIHQWASQGILPDMSIKKEEETNTYGSKFSNMHRLGKVILEAFEEYSLLQLPFSPANEAHEATGTAAKFLAYHGLIAEAITLDELSSSKKKFICFTDDHGWHVSREWLSPEETRGPTALILRGCSQQSLVVSRLDHFLHKLCFLRILDLSYTPLKSLPSSIGCLMNLRLLSLRGCHDLRTLSSSYTTNGTQSSTNTSPYSPLSTLYQLEILDMNGVPFSQLTQEVANKKSNLIFLDMSYSEVTTFPPNFFHDMSNLEKLILGNCSKLVEVPTSMVALYSLTTLEIAGTQIKYFPKKIFDEMQNLQSLKLIDNKKLVSLPESISRAHGLIDLHIEGYESTMLEEIKLEGHPTLISFILIRAPHIRRLSLRGCGKLESVEFKNLDALDELDLSNTAIKDLLSSIPNVPHLRRLIVVGVPSLGRFPWHKLERLPEVFYLDHCTEGNDNHSDHVARVCVSDSRFFLSFCKTSVDLVRGGRFFQSFYVRVAPCLTSGMRQHDEGGMLDSKLQVLLQKKSRYVDVHTMCYADGIGISPATTAPLHRTKRHVEVTRMQSALGGLRYLLSVTKSISVSSDSSIETFDELSDFVELEECELRWCCKMEEVFFSGDLKNLRNVHICSLKSLVSFCSAFCHLTFSSLAHLHLEDCPRLEHVVPHGTTLPCLKTLDILFCYNLKTIFIHDEVYDDSQADTFQLASLQRVRLQELPLLQHFHDKDATLTAPMWKDLHVRGCWSLQRLPRLDVELSEKVKVSGERRWWSKLHWDSLSRRNSYEPKLPPKFASFDEHAVMTSYLR